MATAHGATSVRTIGMPGMASGMGHGGGETCIPMALVGVSIMRVKPTWLNGGHSVISQHDFRVRCNMDMIGPLLPVCGYGDGLYSSLGRDDWFSGRGFGAGPWVLAGVYPNGSGRGIHNENR